MSTRPVIPIHYKAAAENLDYDFKWVDWLNGDTITSVNITIEAIAGDGAEALAELTGAVLDPATPNAITAKVWLTKGVVGNRYTVTCAPTTVNSPARVGEQSVEVHIIKK